MTELKSKRLSIFRNCKLYLSSLNTTKAQPRREMSGCEAITDTKSRAASYHPSHMPHSTQYLCVPLGAEVRCHQTCRKPGKKETKVQITRVASSSQNPCRLLLLFLLSKQHICQYSKFAPSKNWTKKPERMWLKVGKPKKERLWFCPLHGRKCAINARETKLHSVKLLYTVHPPCMYLDIWPNKLGPP